MQKATSGHSSPWDLVFDLRERETEWSDANQARLVKILAQSDMHLSLEELQQRYKDVLALLPDLGAPVGCNDPDLRRAAHNCVSYAV